MVNKDLVDLYRAYMPVCSNYPEAAALMTLADALVQMFQAVTEARTTRQDSPGSSPDIPQ